MNSIARYVIFLYFTRLVCIYICSDAQILAIMLLTPTVISRKTCSQPGFQYRGNKLYSTRKPKCIVESIILTSVNRLPQTHTMIESPNNSSLRMNPNSQQLTTPINLDITCLESYLQSFLWKNQILILCLYYDHVSYIQCLLPKILLSMLW